jgi:hypothetical protein
MKFSTGKQQGLVRRLKRACGEPSLMYLQVIKAQLVWIFGLLTDVLRASTRVAKAVRPCRTKSMGGLGEATRKDAHACP